MNSTWGALLPQYKIEKRVLALNSYCRFMSVASKIPNLTESDVGTKMIETLWGLVRPSEANLDTKLIMNSALEELGKFNKSLFKPSYFPGFVNLIFKI